MAACRLGMAIHRLHGPPGQAGWRRRDARSSGPEAEPDFDIACAGAGVEMRTVIFDEAVDRFAWLIAIGAEPLFVSADGLAES